MPVHNCQINNEPGYKWGKAGKCYSYNPDDEGSKKDAKKKAIAQGIAIGDFEAIGAQINSLKESYKFAISRKVGFDWDGTASTSKGKEMIKRALDNGDLVYIVTARSSKEGISIEGIPNDRIYAVGSNEEKVKKVKELGLNTFWDNNINNVRKMPGVGKLFN